MGKLKLHKTLAKTNFVKTLIQKGICEVKEMADHSAYKLNPQLIKDLVDFIEKEIADSKYANKQFEKSTILYEVLKGCFDMSDDEIDLVRTQVEFLLDNKLVKKNTFLTKGLKLALQCIGSRPKPQN